MGAVPKRRISTARKGRRRSAIKLKWPQLTPCPECQQPKKPHQACPHCGLYKKAAVVSRKSTKEKTKTKATQKRKQA